MIPERLQKRVSELSQAWTQARRKVGESRALLEECLERSVRAVEAQELAQQVAQQVQQQAHEAIAGVVSQCLEAVFDEPYEFKILFDRKRGRTEAQLVFERDGEQVDPLTASGGGVIDVAAFALRLSCLMLSQPPVRKLLVLDEPFKFVSREYIGRVRTMLEKLAEDMEVQFVIVTHINELRCGTVVQL